MKQDSSAFSRRSTNGRSALPCLALGGCLLLSAVAPASAATPPPPGRQPARPAAGFDTASEFSLGGSYAEACTDPPLCPGEFGSDRPGAGCRKVMVFQIGDGQWHGTNLGSLSVAVVAQAADGRTVRAGQGDAWPVRELWLPEDADSAQCEGLTRAMGLMLFGPGGPPFTKVERVPLATGFTAKRIFVEAVGKLRMILVPAPSINGTHPPEVSNVGRAFRFLGPMKLYDADTLYCAPDGLEPVAATGRSALAATFGWSSEAAYAPSAARAEDADR
jgi:hypothetical protein